MGSVTRALTTALVMTLAALPTYALAQGVASCAQAPAPRTAVADIARLIRASYFDATRATRIANGLEADAKAGLFDRYTDPRDLAFVLTKRLSTEDRHFAVSWAPKGNDATTTVAALDDSDTARANHGFSDVAVLPGGVGYVKLDLFAGFEGPGSPQQAAADAALRFVAGTPSLIIDLRDNGGGSPNMVAYLVQQFVAEPAKVASVFRSRTGLDGYELSPVASTLPKRLDTPLFILVSARTGSSAEALAYTLQAAGRAVIVGERTGGAANPGSARQTADGFSIFISVSTPVNPITGTNWEGRGVTPDVAVPQDDALRVARILALEAEGKALPRQAALVLETLKAETAANAADQALAGRFGDLQIAESGGALRLVQGRRPLRTLVPLGADRFSLAEEPAARFAVERAGPGGDITALVRTLPGGGEIRYPRMMEMSATLQ
ncbi:S41 family peptidase [Sandaracinobacter neustonicus]|nr:S41 family peptidase [Sandaracinobacter neustonicus]